MGKGRYESSDDDPQDEDRHTGYQTRNRRYHYEDREEEEQDEYYGKHRPQRYRSRPSEYEDWDDEETPMPRRRPSSASVRYDDDYRPRSKPRARPVRPVKQRKRGTWLTLLAGCGIGIFLCVAIIAAVAFIAFRTVQTGGSITNLPGLLTNHTYTQSASQSFSSTNISAIVICDSVGNVTLSADSTATKPTVAIKKIVQTSSQSNADTMFQQMSVAIQAPMTTTQTANCPTSSTSGTAASTATPTASSVTNNTVLITANIPGTNTLTNAIDLTITLPASMLASAGPAMQLNINAPQGNISVNGISGLLNLLGSNGNINVTNAILTGGSQIGTSTGNIVFSGYLSASNNGTQAARYVMQSEHNITVTLPDNPNITVDANTNIGTITSDYPISVDHPVKDSASYNGPLDPTNTTGSGTTTPTLVLDVSTGNIIIHKLTATQQ